MPQIEVKESNLKEFINLVAERSIHRILLTDYASIEPRKVESAFVLAPMVKVVATAFDRDRGFIYRWSEQDESERMVTIIAGTGKGPNPSRLASRKEEVRQILREEGFEVDEGEWTPESAEAFLDARRRAIG
jgi:hypothetical protein